MSEPTEIVGDQLRTLIERIEHVEEEIKELTEAKKEIYLEAKGNGFDPRSSARWSASESRTQRSATNWRPWWTPICKRSRTHLRAKRKPAKKLATPRGMGLPS